MLEKMNEAQKSLAQRFLIYKGLTSMWFVSAIWLYFYRVFISDHQVGILEGIALAIGLLAEVPSGVLADRFGRDRMVKLGQIMAGSGLLIQALSSSFTPFVIGQTITVIGVAFVSGADEALFFDKLKFDESSLAWRRLVTRGSQVGLVCGFFAVVTGGFFYSLHPRLPWLLNGLVFMIASFSIWNIRETEKRTLRRELLGEIGHHFADIGAGFMQFLKPSLLLYIPIILVVQGLFYAAGWGMLRLVLLDRYGFSPSLGSFVIAGSSLITVGMLSLLDAFAHKFTEQKVIVAISLVALASLMVSVGEIGLVGGLVILALYVGEHVLYPFMSEVLNLHTNSEQRATVLSVGSFLRTLPYVGLAPLIGYLNDRDQLEVFLVGWSVLILIAVVLFVIAKKKGKSVALPSDIVLESQPRVPEVVEA